MASSEPLSRRRRVPRVSGRQAVIASSVGIALMIVAFFIPHGVVIFITGPFLIGGSLALWLMNRYGVLESIERSADWMQSAPRYKDVSNRK